MLGTRSRGCTWSLMGPRLKFRICSSIYQEEFRQWETLDRAIRCLISHNVFVNSLTLHKWTKQFTFKLQNRCCILHSFICFCQYRNFFIHPCRMAGTLSKIFFIEYSSITSKCINPSFFNLISYGYEVMLHRYHVLSEVSMTLWCTNFDMNTSTRLKYRIQIHLIHTNKQILIK